MLDGAPAGAEEFRDEVVRPQSLTCRQASDCVPDFLIRERRIQVLQVFRRVDQLRVLTHIQEAATSVTSYSGSSSLTQVFRAANEMSGRVRLQRHGLLAGACVLLFSYLY